MSKEETIAVVRQLWEQLDKRNVNGVVAECAPNAVWHGFAPQDLDNNGYRQAIAVFLDAFTDSRFPIDDLFAEENKAVVRHRLVGTHLGNLMGNPPTDKPVQIPAIAIFRVENGKVAEVWLSADLLGMLQQVGAIPAPSA